MNGEVFKGRRLMIDFLSTAWSDQSDWIVIYIRDGCFANYSVIQTPFLVVSNATWHVLFCFDRRVPLLPDKLNYFGGCDVL
jgi:hypothetical protein